VPYESFAGSGSGTPNWNLSSTQLQTNSGENSNSLPFMTSPKKLGKVSLETGPYHAFEACLLDHWNPCLIRSFFGIASKSQRRRALNLSRLRLLFVVRLLLGLLFLLLHIIANDSL